MDFSVLVGSFIFLFVALLYIYTCQLSVTCHFRQSLNFCFMVFPYFSASHLLRVESAGSDDVEKLAIGELFEVLYVL